MLDTQFLTQKELESVLSVVRYHNVHLSPGVAQIGLRDDVRLVDSNGEPVGTLAYNADADEYVFHYPATTIRERT